MNAERIAQIAELFDRALDLPESDRSAFLDDACQGDFKLREEVRSLLMAHESGARLFEDLSSQVVSPALAALADPSAQHDDALLARLQSALSGSYRIERELGGGAMSRVFLAEDVRLGRPVVIKVLPPGLVESVSSERFRREIQLVAQLQHAHIVPLLTSDTADGFLYYTMPYVTGESLRARIAREAALPLKDAQKFWRDVLDALAHAHASGVVHRDIKPANILLGVRNALVADFGIARALEAAADDAGSTATGLVVGTPAYMAPEQITGAGDVDARADVYAAGLVMHEMLEGQLPFTAGSTRELVLARLTQDAARVTRPDCPPALADLVQRCLERDPAGRPQSAEEILVELEHLHPSAGTVETDRDRAAQPPGETGFAGGLRSRRRLAQAAVVGMLFAGVFFAARSLTPAAARQESGATAQWSLAVLPLINLSTDPSDASLADGMTEELTSTLSRGGGLRVIGKTSVIELQGRRLSVRQIADSLGVSHFLEGSLQKTGSRMRLQVRLVDARDGSTLWSQTYDRELGDIFVVQDDIAGAVAGELDVRLAGRGAPARRATPSITAYRWYLHGINAVRVGGSGNSAEAEAYFQRAIAEDSNFAAAYARLAFVQLYRAGSEPGDHRLWYERSERVALKAVALDDSLPEAHAALGWARLAQRRYESAERALRRAIALDPSGLRAQEGLARIYAQTGRRAEQLAAAQRGLESDPYSVQALREMALALSSNGRCAESLGLVRPLKDLTPPAGVAGVIRGLCYAQREMWSEAIAEYEWSMRHGARVSLALLGHALARSGRRDEALAILDDLVAGRRNSHGAFGIAVVHAGLRDYEQAFSWLERAFDEGSARVYLWDPTFADLHRDPRFARVTGLAKR